MSENQDHKAEKKAKKEIVFKSNCLHDGKEYKKGDACPKELVEHVPDFCLEESK